MQQCHRFDSYLAGQCEEGATAVDSAQIISKVKEILDPLAADQGALVEGVEFNAGANPPTLAVTVDRTDGIESLS